MTINSKVKGDIAEAAVIAAFLRAGFNVLIPFGDRNRYDIVLERDGKFQRIQIKTARIARGCLAFNTCSNTRRNGERISTCYTGQIEAFAVYYPITDSIYFVPVETVPTRTAYLRLDRSFVAKHCRYADDFIFTAHKSL